MTFRVLVDDNYHFMDEAERYEAGSYPTLEASTQAAQTIVDEFLLAALQPGLSAQQLFHHYTAFGEDPFIAKPGGGPAPFSAWNYAWRRCNELCPGSSPATSASPDRN